MLARPTVVGVLRNGARDLWVLGDLAPRGDAGLRGDLAEVGLDRLGAWHQLSCHLTVREPVNWLACPRACSSARVQSPRAAGTATAALATKAL